MYRRRKGGRWCSAPNCHRNSISYPGMTFFRFPKDDERARKWIVNCKRQDLFGKDANYLHQNLKLCSLHFEDKMIANFLKNRLKPDAVPTLFPVPNPPKLIQNQTKLLVDSIQTSSRFYDGLSQNEVATCSPVKAELPQTSPSENTVCYSAPSSISSVEMDNDEPELPQTSTPENTVRYSAPSSISSVEMDNDEPQFQDSSPIELEIGVKQEKRTKSTIKLKRIINRQTKTIAFQRRQIWRMKKRIELLKNILDENRLSGR